MRGSATIAVNQFPEVTRKVAAAIGDAGGRAWVVGGFVRDELVGRASKDFDLEVYGPNGFYGGSYSSGTTNEAGTIYPDGPGYWYFRVFSEGGDASSTQGYSLWFYPY